MYIEEIFVMMSKSVSLCDPSVWCEFSGVCGAWLRRALLYALRGGRAPPSRGIARILAGEFS